MVMLANGVAGVQDHAADGAEWCRHGPAELIVVQLAAGSLDARAVLQRTVAISLGPVVEYVVPK